MLDWEGCIFSISYQHLANCPIHGNPVPLNENFAFQRGPIVREPAELSGAIERTLRVLQCVAESGTFTAKTIAEQAGIPTSTAYRLLQTLNGMNFVEKASHGGFRIGREYVRLASLVTRAPIGKPTRVGSGW